MEVDEFEEVGEAEETRSHLIVPNYELGFSYLAYERRFLGFCYDVDSCNGAIGHPWWMNERWIQSLCELHDAWDGKWYGGVFSEQQKDEELLKAIYQLFPDIHTEVAEYWREKAEVFNRPQILEQEYSWEDVIESIKQHKDPSSWWIWDQCQDHPFGKEVEEARQAREDALILMRTDEDDETGGKTPTGLRFQDIEEILEGHDFDVYKIAQPRKISRAEYLENRNGVDDGFYARPEERIEEDEFLEDTMERLNLE